MRANINDIHNVTVKLYCILSFWLMASLGLGQSITVTKPSSGDVYTPGSTMTITWNDDFDPSHVGIDLIDGSGNVELTIDEYTSNTGSYNWSIPASFTTGNYQIEVYQVSELCFTGETGCGNYVRGSAEDKSGVFSIEERSITVTSPTGSTSKIGGETLTINWSSNYSADNVSIVLYKGGTGGLAITLTSSTTNDGVFYWEIPGSIATGSDYHIRVKDTGSTVLDDSPNFTLTKRSITVTSPSSTTSKVGGQTLTINWDTNYSGDDVRIELYKGGSRDQTLTSSTANDGAYDWTVPTGISTGSDYQIRVKDNSSSVDDYSANFTLNQAVVTISNPSGGEEFDRGQTLAVNWSDNYGPAEIWIDLLNGDDSVNQTLAENTTNDGAYSWTIPSGLAAGNYSVKIYEAVMIPCENPPCYQRGEISDQSGTITVADFEIVLAPGYDGSSVEGESDFYFEWSHNLLDGSQELHYWNGLVWVAIDTLALSTTSYTWTTPLANLDSTQVRISSTTKSIAKDYIDIDLVRVISVTSPSPSIEKTGGETLSIEWEANYTGSSIQIDLYKGGTFDQTLASSIATNEETFSWNIPTDIATDSNYQVQVKDTGSETGEMSSKFTLTQSSLTVTNPTTSTDYNGGQTLSISWDANYSSGNVGVYLYKGSFLDQTLTNSTANDGSYDWDIPVNITPGSDYKIKISDTRGFPEANSAAFTLNEGSMAKGFRILAYDSFGNVTHFIDEQGTHIYHYYGDNTAPFSQSSSNGTFLTGIQKQVGDNDCPDNCGTRPTGNEVDDLFFEAEYDPFGNIIRIIDENGTEATFAYDNFHRLQSVRNADSLLVSEHLYVLTGSQFSATNPNYVATTMWRNGTEALSATEYLDGLGRSIQRQQETGSGVVVSAIGYDEQGRPWRRWKPYERTGTAGFDAASDSLAQDFYSNSWPYVEEHFEKSPLGRTVKVIPEGGEAAGGADSTAYRLDRWNGNTYKVATSFDAEGKATETWTDGWGRTVRTIADPSGINAETTFEYDLLGKLTNVTAPNGLVTTYAYDPRGQLISKTSPDAGTVRYKYDNARNLRFSQDAGRAGADDVVFTSYDKLGRPTAEGVAAAGFSGLDGDTSYSFETTGANLHGTYVYDSKPKTTNFPWNKFASLIDGAAIINTQGQLAARAWRVDEGFSSVIGTNPWQVSLHSYDDEGWLAEKWIWTGDQREWDTHLAYQYNRQGELIKRKVTVGGQTLHQFYEYDQRGLLSKVFANTSDTKPATPEVSYSYTASGAVETIDYKGSKDVAYGYTIRDWVASINDINSPAGNFAAVYNYFDNGNVSKAQFHNPQNQLAGHDRYHWNFGYDTLNRLTSADYGSGSGTASDFFDVTGLTYDKAGNLTGLQRDDETGALIDNLGYHYQSGTNRLDSLYDAAGQQYTWDAGTVASFGYDAGGNLTSQSGKLSNVIYEHRNLPVEFVLAGGDTVIANYNAGGQRILKETSSGAWSFYVMDGPQTLAVIDQSGLSHINLVGNQTFGRLEANAGTIDTSNARRYYISDHLGSTRAVVDDQGQVLETFDYYPFGLLMPKRSSTTGNTIEKFTGKERDEAIGLDYFGARYLDPALGRWLSVDPKADDFPAWSPYNYTLNNPINLFDPDGQAPLDDFVLLANGQVGRVPTGKTDRFFVREGGQDRQLNLSNASDSRLLSSRLESNGTFLNNVITSENPNQQALGLAGAANVRKGGGESLATITKVTAFSVGLAGSLLTGSGIIAGSSGVIAAGTTLGTASSFLGAAESIQNGQEGAAVLKIATSQASKIGFDFGKTINSDVERLIFNSFIFIQEGTANLAITGAEAKEQQIKDEEEEERR